MMASIPNMRSTPLPVPVPKTAQGEAAPGDFAAQMPVPVQPVPAPVPGQTPGLALAAVPAIALLPVDGTEPVAPGSAEAAQAGDEAEDKPADKTETRAETPAGELPLPMIPIPVPGPVVQTRPAAPGPQVLPTVSGDETAPAKAAAVTPELVTTGKPGRRAGTGGEAKPGLPADTFKDVPNDKDVAPEIEAAIKELLQRKEVVAKTAGSAQAATPETGKADTAPVPAQAPAAPVAAPPHSAELPQPVLAALDTQPPAAKAVGTVEEPRSTELATERKLDLARETEWLDRLARDIARAGANDAPLRFRLHPQTLGSLHVELQQGDHGTAVRLTVETEAARSILADAQPRLAAEARAQGVRITETHVDLSGSGREAPGERRRQDETRQNPLIRTARGAGTEAVVASARATDRARLDRYA